MAIKDALLPEFDHEMGSTRRVLERVPAADLKWTPHEKSFNMGQLAWHISNIPNWTHATLDASVFDLASIGDDARPKEPTSVAEVLKAFDESVKKARDKIAEQTDSAFLSPWTLKQGGQEMFTMPKIAVAAQLRDESHHPPPRPAHGLPAVAQRAAPRALRAVR